MSKELDVDEVVSILEDAMISTQELENLLEQHDLKSNLNCKCELCSDFRVYEYETTWWPNLQCFSLGIAVLNHPTCDEKLAKRILAIAQESSDGDWKLEFDCAHISNSKRTAKELLDLCDNRTNIIRLVKAHPNLTAEIEKEILESYGWKEWPSDEYLENYTGRWIVEDADDLQSIQLQK
jgi:hypothetical protein